jgi:hypothetical protein
MASIGILQQRSVHRQTLLAEQLQSALNSRVVIEQAKGVLAEFTGRDMDASYRALRTYARGKGAKLSEVAAALVRRELPPSDVVPEAAWDHALLQSVAIPRVVRDDGTADGSGPDGGA